MRTQNDFMKVRKEKLITNHSGLQSRTLFRNKDWTYTVYVECFDTDLKCTHAYQMDYGLFGEAIECVNYQRERVS